MVHIDSDRINFIPEEERWDVPYDDNTHRQGRDEFYVLTIARSCDSPNNHHDDCGCDGREMEQARPLSSVRITRNHETNTFVLYLDGESVLEGQWAETPSGRGPNGHKKVLRRMKMFAYGWMAAEFEVPVQDVRIHNSGHEG